MRDEYNAEIARLGAVLQSVPVAAIAFAMHETSNRIAELALIPIALAVVAWASSFAAGIFNSRARQRALKQAMAQDLFRAAGDDDNAKKLGRDFDRSQKTMHRTHGVQVWGLLGGALLYAVGHGMHIAALPSAPAVPQPAVAAIGAATQR